MKQSETSAIEIRNVSFGYHNTQLVLKNIDAIFHPSTITAIIGASGSGKSTLLQLINGMIRPFKGDVRLFDAPIDYGNIYEQRLKIGYVVQQIGLFPHMTISDNISLLGRIVKKSKEERKDRVNELMKMVQLPQNYLDKYPHELSVGEQQRAGLCRAMLLKPPVLLMDEPFASLDTGTKQNIYRHLLGLHEKENTTMILVTHNWEETYTLADHFIWIKDGRINAAGEKADLQKLKEAYLNDVRDTKSY